MKRTLLLATMIVLSGCQSGRDQPGTGYFKVAGPTEADTFVIALTDPATIAEARAMASEEAPSKHVTGLVVAEAVPYNAPWSFHLDPASISFAEMSIEVCDAATSYVEEHLAEVGDAFLPGRRWCPWSSRVVGEIE
ncbi:MAG TPA: hypothetical protein VJ790_17345 [Dongiaceae bacterium]|nr:hypothetical protein [Dongiaceae bacterium]